MKNLVELRNSKDLSQRQIAKDLGITDKAYWSYENGRTEPNIETLIKLADYFDVSLDYLCGRPNKNLVFVDGLSQEKRQLIEIIKTLTEEETLIALGWVAKLTNKPIEEVMKKIR